MSKELNNFKPIGVPKFQGGTNKGGILWTSEDVNNPVYSKKKPLSILELKDLYIKDVQNKGLKNFDKAAQIGFGIARLHPTYGIAMNILDNVNAFKEAKETGTPPDFLEYMSNNGGALGKSTYNAGVRSNNRTHFKNIVLKNHAKIGGPATVALGLTLGLPDYILDIKNLYNTVTE